jgi:sugar transferase (PEP-CTERM system associated)
MNQFIIAYVAGDLVCALCGLTIAFFIRFGGLVLMDSIAAEILRFVLFMVVLVFSSFLLEIYNLDKEFETLEIGARVALSLVLSFVILSSLYYLISFATQGRGLLILSLASFGLLQFFWHAFFNIWLKSPGLAKRVLVLGTGQLAGQMGKLITSTRCNHVLTGYLRCGSEPVNVPECTIVGSEENIMETAKRENVHKIVVSMSEKRGVFPLESVLICKFSGIKVMDAPAFYENATGKLLLEHINPSWFIFSQGFKLTSMFRIVKRMMDLVVASALLILILPLLPIIAILIKLDSPGPVLFRQNRVGRGDTVFTLYKFRTMGVDAEKTTGAVWAQENDPRITSLGRILRKTRIDEIPQLYNVFRGDMSLVGPRPERPEFVKELKTIIPYYSGRHYLKPGITGWAQVCYPYGASVEDALEKLRYDMYYIKNGNIAFDLLIIIKTIKVVLFGRGGR